jgi:hypothetical protein
VEARQAVEGYVKKKTGKKMDEDMIRKADWLDSEGRHQSTNEATIPAKHLDAFRYNTV